MSNDYHTGYSEGTIAESKNAIFFLECEMYYMYHKDKSVVDNPVYIHMQKFIERQKARVPNVL
jgi:hypothetical protein